jgi:hypothetical protein
MPHALLDVVHQRLAEAGFALADAIDRLPADQRAEAEAVARQLVEAQQRLTSLTARPVGRASAGSHHRA